MKSREEVLHIIQTMMWELFEIEQQNITLQARLYEDLDFDSIDAIDMIVRLEKMTDQKIKPENFKNARTINDVVEAVFNLINE